MYPRLGFRQLPAPQGRPIVVLVAAAACAVFAGTAAADDGVAVHADHYVAAGRVFQDVDALARAVAVDKSQGLRITACLPGVTRALTAVVRRFRDVPLRIEVRHAAEPPCASDAPALVPVVQHTTHPRADIDDAAVERFWSDLLP